jgi:hypothetical protein
MSTSGFSRYVLRTTGIEAAAAFYDVVLGRRGDGIVRLPESAIARGAPAHWLGHIGVGQRGGAQAVADGFVARGATRLGPPVAKGEAVVLRDPGGAVVAVTDDAPESSAGVRWHQLNTHASSDAAASSSPATPPSSRVDRLGVDDLGGGAKKSLPARETGSQLAP